MSFWDDKYDRPDYVFGTEPNAFLVRQAHRLRAGGRVLALADGEGRNGVFLAGRGLDVHSVDGSAVALAKAARLAQARGVTIRTEQADLADWPFPPAAYDAVVAIFIQFAPPDLRARLFAGITTALRPGGLLLLEGYRPEQRVYRTGGPDRIDHLYTEPLLRAAFAALTILDLDAYDAELNEGCGHVGRSALIDLVARKPGG